MIILGTIGPLDLTVVFMVALLVFGPKKLPDVGRQLGAALRDLRKLSSEFTGTLAGVRDDMVEMHEDARRSLASVDPLKVLDSAGNSARTEDVIETPSAFQGKRGLRLTTVPAVHGSEKDETK